MEAAQQAAGRRHKLAYLLRLNKIGAKEGDGADAPEWWAAGKLRRLAEYCMRDVTALAELVARPTAYVAARHTTTALALRPWVAEPTDEPPPTPAADDAHDTPIDTDARNMPRSKRKLTTPIASYDETVRRRSGPRDAQRVVYLRRGQDHSVGCKRTAIVLGPYAIERIVRGRYEWRDANLPPQKGPRKRLWEHI